MLRLPHTDVIWKHVKGVYCLVEGISLTVFKLVGTQKMARTSAWLTIYLTASRPADKKLWQV